MSAIIVISRNGEQQTIEAKVGRSVMETIRGSGHDEILALCGGCCSCGTCHVYVAEEWVGKLPAISEDENGLLSIKEHRTARSRLSCQLRLTEALDGLIVKVAPEE
jgi:ferredoxin, 2Fe-2S